MSNKSKTVKTDKASAQGIVPKLRFPEFRDAGAWVEKPLGKVYSFKVTNSFFRDKLNYEKGLVKNIHYGDIHTKFSTLFDIRKEMVPFINSSEAIGKIKSDSYCIEGDMVFADASEDLNDVGKSIEIVNLNNEKLLSGLHTLLARQKKSELVIGFGGYLFKSNDIRTGIKKEAQGAKVLGVSAGRLSNINIYFPTDKKEQQKIADCLSSIDELITAQTQNLDTLKTHKKGLMQQLFPAEGETVPKLRFPEFRDAGAWEEKTLEQVANYANGKAHEKHIDEAGKYVVVNSKFISTEGDVKKFTKRAFCLANKKDVLMVLSDVPNGKAIAKCYFVESDNLYAVNQRICKLKPKNIVAKLLFYILDRNPFFLAFDDGVKQTNLRKDDVLGCPILLPSSPDEQKKIADCLSSIDEIIDRQVQKIGTLKAHKKGLMQQLFPSTDEVTG